MFRAWGTKHFTSSVLDGGYNIFPMVTP